jgi:DNA ligase-1
VRGDEVKLFSRRLENLTDQFPDLCDELRSAVKAEEAILDGECVPVDPNTGELLPFQVVAHRRGRKHGIEEVVKEVPVTLFLFDALYLNGEDLTPKPYPKRRKALEKILTETDRLKLAEHKFLEDPDEIGRFFEEAIQDGTEGLILKSIRPDSVYEAGKRGFEWIKWKRSYRSEMRDTVDLVVVGAFVGRGKRAGTYGALLMAAYDPDTDTFKTVSKLGSGFTDEDLAALPKMFKPHIIKHRHSRVESIMEPDYWITPAKVLEVIGDEITLSPMHVCGMDMIKKGSGLAIRFPRLVKFRDDRAPEDATTVKEIVDMYKSQLKTIR